MITSTTADRQDNRAACDIRPEWLPLAGGAALVFLALAKRRTLFGLAALLGGGYAVYRAVENGTLRLPQDLSSLGLPSDLAEQLKAQAGRWQMGPSAEPMRNQSVPKPEDFVDEASMESFPASDPPQVY